MLTWAWPQSAWISHLFLNPLSLEHIGPRKSPDYSRDPRAWSRSCLTAFLEKLSGQRDSRPGRVEDTQMTTRAAAQKSVGSADDPTMVTCRFLFVCFVLQSQGVYLISYVC